MASKALNQTDNGFGWYMAPEEAANAGSTINRYLHAGIRIGKAKKATVLPISLLLALLGLGYTIYSNMQLKGEIDKYKGKLSRARKKAKGYSTRRVKKVTKYTKKK